jgi:hypothetical protein
MRLRMHVLRLCEMFCNKFGFYGDELLPTFSQILEKKMGVHWGSAWAVYRF